MASHTGACFSRIGPEQAEIAKDKDKIINIFFIIDPSDFYLFKTTSLADIYKIDITDQYHEIDRFQRSINHN